MSYQETMLLRESTQRMFKAAERDFANGDYDLAAFMAEQSVQLHKIPNPQDHRRITVHTPIKAAPRHFMKLIR